jgi:endonuclease/exonuclease/phosphatase family metal-dependent hydrolase
MYKIVLRTIFTFFLFFTWIPCASAQTKFEQITVMSYNIHFGVGMDGVYDINRIANVIKKSKADIIGLEEVDVNFEPQTNFDNQIQLLAEKLHMHYFYAPIYDVPPFYTPMYYAHPGKSSSRRQSGVAILSRFPIDSTENHLITRLSTIEPNPSPLVMPGFAEAVINIKGIKIPFFVTHLDYREDKTIRSIQVQEMIPIILRKTGESVLIGDLNAPPDEPELDPLFNIYQDTLAACTNQCFTFPSDSPKLRLDYILVTHEIRTYSSQVMETTASDHRPVVANLEIQGKHSEKQIRTQRADHDKRNHMTK